MTHPVVALTGRVLNCLEEEPFSREAGGGKHCELMLATLSPEPGLRPQAASASLGPHADEVSFSRLIFVFRKVGRSKLGCSASE